MSKSATDFRPWGFKGQFVMADPVSLKAIEQSIVLGCKCSGCEANRRWLEQQEKVKAGKTLGSL